MAEVIEVTGMVIASGPVGEYDKRVVLLTRELGKISAFARGARKPGNALMAACESFAFGTFFIYPGRNSYTVEKAAIKTYFRELADDLVGACYGYYFLEFADYFAYFFLPFGKPFYLVFCFRLKLFRFFFRARQIFVRKFFFVKENVFAYFLQIAFDNFGKFRHQNPMTAA